MGLSVQCVTNKDKGEQRKTAMAVMHHAFGGIALSTRHRTLSLVSKLAASLSKCQSGQRASPTSSTSSRSKTERATRRPIRPKPACDQIVCRNPGERPGKYPGSQATYRQDTSTPSKQLRPELARKRWLRDRASWKPARYKNLATVDGGLTIDSNTDGRLAVGSL